MARTIEEIQNEMIAAKQADPVLSNLNSPSATAIWRLWTFIMAVAINLHEQFLDLSKLELEQIARESVAGTIDWLQRRVLEFQYSASNPQIVTVVDGRASYDPIDASLRIITRASVKEQASGCVLVKVAKGVNPLEQLNTSELNALISYLDAIGFVGIPIDTISLNADRLRFEGEIFYGGQFVESSVKANVILAINNYLSNISISSFDGIVNRERLIDAIQAVPGVQGVDTLNVIMNGRPEQDALGGSNNIIIERNYETSAGYIIEEDTPGNTFEDTITMILSA